MKKLFNIIFIFLFVICLGAGGVFVFGETKTYAEDSPQIHEINITQSNFIDVMSDSNNYNDPNVLMKLTEDIHLNDVNLSSIYSQERVFKGIFDGNGKMISDITLSSVTSNYGLFPRADGATIKNLKMAGDITIDFGEDVRSKNVGVIVGYGYGVTIEQCQVGEYEIHGLDRETRRSKIIQKLHGEVEGPDTSDTLTLNGVMSFGAIAGVLDNGSVARNCLTYLTMNVDSIVEGATSVYIGGTVGVQRGGVVENAASRLGVSVGAHFQGLSYYVGGITGQVIYEDSVVRNTVYTGTIEKTAGQNNLCTTYFGGAIGHISNLSGAPSNGNISYNYWLPDQNLGAFGLNSTEYQPIHAGEHQINDEFLHNTDNWYGVGSSGWDFALIWMYNQRLQLQIFQTFKITFATSPTDAAIFTCTQNTSGDSYIYGADVVFNIEYEEGKSGFYVLDRVKKDNNEFTDYTLKMSDSSADGGKKEVEMIETTQNFEISFKAKATTAGEYSIEVIAKTFEGIIESEDYAKLQNNIPSNRGGVMIKGDSHDRKQVEETFSINDLTHGRTVIAKPFGIYSFDYWELLQKNPNGKWVATARSNSTTAGLEGGDTVVDKGAFRVSSSHPENLIIYFGGTKPSSTEGAPGDNALYVRTDFKLVAHFTDIRSIQVTFSFSNGKGVRSVEIYGQIYDRATRTPIVVPGTGETELKITVEKGYEINKSNIVEHIMNVYRLGYDYASNREKDQLLRSQLENISVDEDTYLDARVYIFTIDLAALLGNRQSTQDEKVPFDLNLPTISRKEDNGPNLLWLYITLPIAFVVIVGLVILFIILRNRHLAAVARAGGNGEHVHSKQKKQKGEKTNYKDYY